MRRLILPAVAFAVLGCSSAQEEYDKALKTYEAQQKRLTEIRVELSQASKKAAGAANAEQTKEFNARIKEVQAELEEQKQQVQRAKAALRKVEYEF